MVKASVASVINCVDFFCLYPKEEFYMDELIHLWIAQGLFDHEENAQLCFEDFVDRSEIIESSSVDTSTGRLRYKLNRSSLASNNYYFRSDDTDSYISRKTLHASIRDSIDPSCLTDLYQAENLRTLLILHDYKSRLDQLPDHLFLKLPLLVALELSHTNIKELPSTIRYLKDLRYLNLSFTPISTLPNSLCTLSNLQTLDLRGCSKLICLPRSMSQLTKLRHLNVDVTCLLVFMPPGFGGLAELQTLPAFIVGKENGCHITELKQMVNLRGAFRILRLENVSSSKEAMQAALEQKKYISKLELHWSKLQDGFELLENLRPCKEIQELEVLGYGGTKFPSWIGEPLFTKLTNITIHDCRNCKVFPPLGQLPSLESLCISDMHAIEVINHHFYGRNKGMESLDLNRLELGTTSKYMSTTDMFMALPVFPALKSFTINGMPMLEEWCGIEEGDFPHLQNLNISNCSKLTAIPKLSHLKLLKKLEISLGPSLQSFSNERLPTSLQYLVIIDCPLLKEKCLNDDEENWRKLVDIPNIWIDYQQMTKVSYASNQAQDVEVADASHHSPAPVQAQVDIGLLKQTMEKDYVTGFPSKIEGETNMEGVHIYPMPETSEDARSDVKVKGGSARRRIPRQSWLSKIMSNLGRTVLESTSSASDVTDVSDSTDRGKRLRIDQSTDAPEFSLGSSTWGNIHQGSRSNKITSDWTGNFEELSLSVVTDVSDSTNRGKHSRIIKSASPELSFSHASDESDPNIRKIIDQQELLRSFSWQDIPQGSRFNKITSDWRGNFGELSLSAVTDVSDSTDQGKHLRIVKSADAPELSFTHASDEPDSKRRRKDSCFIEPDMGSRLVGGRITKVVPTDSEVDFCDDGYYWRKYDQKDIKGNPNPRSYYRCVIAGCFALKHIERESLDPKYVTTTYRGEHNHDVGMNSPVRDENDEESGPDIYFFF